MTDSNSNKRPNDDSSVGSASKKLNMDNNNEEGKTNEHREGNDFRYDVEEENGVLIGFLM